MFIINVYAPTKSSDDLTKQLFYGILEENAKQIPGEDILLFIGDFNAQIDKENCFRDVASTNSIHDKTNNNGERLCNLAAALNMDISSTRYKHKDIHKITWMRPGSLEGNQIDHVLITKTYKQSINDVHILVITKCKIKTTKNERRKAQRKWEVYKLKEEEVRSRRRVQEVNTEIKFKEQQMEEQWKKITLGIKNAAEKVVGKMQNKEEIIGLTMSAN
ncbi:uncharacterized protein [Diabrotica undecimpunctata]|uniref:uncharacterized protein n=1 Tax=Diabrotica undecimpunctata TaxID=50387 RepID=UPI003B637551